MRDKKLMLMLFIILVAVLLSSFSFALEDDEDWEIIPGVEGEKAINIGSAILAIVLFVLTVVAYTKTNRKRLLYVSAAFLIFAVKSLLVGSELFISEIAWVDPVASVLDFAIMLCFFVGIIKK